MRRMQNGWEWGKSGMWTSSSPVVIPAMDSEESPSGQWEMKWRGRNGHRNFVEQAAGVGTLLHAGIDRDRPRKF